MNKRTYEFFEEIPGEEQPTPAPTPAPEEPTPDSEVVNTPKPNEEKTVPYSRFQEVNQAAKDAKEAAAAATAEVERIKRAFNGPEPEEDTLDPAAEKALAAYLASQGFVRKEDLNKVTAAEQAARDLEALKTEQKLSDEDLEKVRAQAVKMGAANAEGLKAAYTTLFMDKIVEDKVKEALAGKTPPAPSSANNNGEPTPPAKYSAKDALKNRIKSAASNLK